MLVGNKIEIAERVFFAEAEADVLTTSEPVLLAVNEVLNAHPEIEHLLIEGHANTRGDDDDNYDLSFARADAVRDWMIRHGADRHRLVAQGFGEDRPLVGDSDEDAMIINRRVEFTVLRADETPDSPQDRPNVDALPEKLKEWR